MYTASSIKANWKMHNVAHKNHHGTRTEITKHHSKLSKNEIVLHLPNKLKASIHNLRGLFHFNSSIMSKLQKLNIIIPKIHEKYMYGLCVRGGVV
jgi:hypothetical protein